MAVFTRENLHLPAADAGPLLPAGARASALLWQGAAAGAGLVLGAGQVYGGAAPFGLALVIGCPPGYLFAAGAGALAAGLVFQPLAMGLRLAGALAAAVAGRWLGGGKARTGALAGCLALLAVQALELFFAGGVPDPAGLAATGCTALLAAGFGWAAASVIRRCAIRPSGDSAGTAGAVPGHHATTGASGSSRPVTRLSSSEAASP